MTDLQLGGLHHLTAITADAPGNLRFYTDDARPAAGQEDGQPGRHQRLPPVLRRRPGDARHRRHLLRLAGRRASGAAPTRSRAPACGSPARRASPGGATRLAERGRRRRARSPRSTAAPPSTSRTPRASASGWSTTAAPATAHPWEREPGAGRAPDPRPRPDHDLACRDLEPTAAVLTGVHEHARRSRTYASPDGDGRRCTSSRWAPGGPAAELHVAVQPGLPAARQGAGGVHHVAFRTPDVEAMHAWTERLQQSRRALERRGRALLLPLALLPRAERHPLRDRHRRPRLRRRRAAGDARASGWRCRPSSSRGAPRSRRGLVPID